MYAIRSYYGSRALPDFRLPAGHRAGVRGIRSRDQEVINKNNTYTVNIYTPKHNYNTGSIDVKLAKIYNNPLPNSTSFPKLGLFKIECN